MNNIRMFFFVFVLSSVVVVNHSESASFDCGKAKSRVEKMICADSELSSMDEDMAKIYFEALKNIDKNKLREFKSNHRLWLKSRNDCSSAGCLKKLYEKRIIELREIEVLSSDDDQNYPDITKAIEDSLSGRGMSTLEDSEVEIPIESNDIIPESDDEYYLEMECKYSSEYNEETASIRRFIPSDDNKPVNPSFGIKTFSKEMPSGKDESFRFILKLNQYAECVFPSGNRVRVKIGSTLPRPYGYCGGSPKVYLSLWVNERKVVSKEWFSGHCYEEFLGYDLGYDICGKQDGMVVTKCHTGIKPMEYDPDKSNQKKQSKEVEPLSVCVEYPDISKYPMDGVEYPTPGSTLLKPGDIEMVYGDGSVSNAVQAELLKDFFVFNGRKSKYSGSIKGPEWVLHDKELQGKLDPCYESAFDFNNDGMLDRTYIWRYKVNYMDNSVLLVQPGRSLKKLQVSDTPMDNSSYYLPFHLDGKKDKIESYPPLCEGEGGDEANFKFEVNNDGNKQNVLFRGRYTLVTPFFLDGTTYIALSCHYEDIQSHVAVLKPLPNGTFQNICLFRLVQDNF